MSNPIILGATGQIGQALARVWPGDAPCGIWQHRPGADTDIIAGFPGPALEWDLLGSPAPALPQDAGSMIVLAGVMGSDRGALARNTDIALVAARAARRAGVPRVLVASTQAVYGTEAVYVSEDSPCAPSAPYGLAKLAMEQALANYPEVTCLRLGNVAGTDMLFQVAARQPVTLDRFVDGKSPQRSYIGPVTLADVLLRLSDPDLPLPPVLNVANPGVLEMSQVMSAAGVAIAWRAAHASALACLEVDVSRLAALVPLSSAEPRALVEEARRGGWRAYVPN